MFRSDDTSIEVFHGSKSVSAMIDVGCSAYGNSGSIVLFKHPDCAGIDYHHPHLDSTTDAMPLQVMAKRLSTRIGWDKESLQLSKKELLTKIALASYGVEDVLAWNAS